MLFRSAYEDLSYEEKRQLLFGEELKTDRKLNEDDIRFTKSMVDSLVLKKKVRRSFISNV